MGTRTVSRRHRQPGWKAILTEYWPFLLPIPLLLLGITGFPFPGSGAPYSDFAVTHYPNAVFLQKALFVDHTIPLWSPNILSGFPFIAHPYSGIWYPPYWLALFFPLPLGLNLLLAAHLVWGGIGAYKLLLQSGITRPSAILGGLVFESAPTLFSHIGAGHLMLLLAVCWTPWLLWSSRHTAVGRVVRFAQPGVTFALIFLADPRWAIYTGLLCLSYELWLGWGNRLHSVFTFAMQALLAAALSAPALWLYSQYGSLSTRSSITPNEVLTLSLPPAGLLGLLIPQPGAFHEWVLYPGAIVFLLAIVAVFQKAGASKFWLAALVSALVLSLGSNIPGLHFLAGLPGFSQLRVPPRALLLAALAFGMLAAQGFEILVTEKPLRRIRLVAVALFSLTLGLAIAAAIGGSEIWQGGVWAAFFIATFWFFFEYWNRLRLRPQTFTVALIALTLMDLLLMDSSLVHFKPAGQVLSEDRAKAGFLAAQPGLFRVYSPSYSIAQQTAAGLGLQLADGVDPLQLSSYASFMQAASGVQASGYSVSLPPFNEDPNTSNSSAQADADALGILNVKYVIAEFPISVNGLQFLKQIDGSYVYENELVRPRAWVETSDGQQDVDRLDWNYNHIRVRASGPGLLVLSEINYPGWSVSIDGNPSPIKTYADILRSVELGSGAHEVFFSFQPLPLLIGLPISILTVLGILLWPNLKKKK